MIQELLSPCPIGRTELVVCHCLQVSEAEVMDAIQLYDLRTLDEVRSCTGAGMGCNSCHHQLRGCLDRAS